MFNNFYLIISPASQLSFQQQLGNNIWNNNLYNDYSIYLTAVIQITDCVQVINTELKKKKIYTKQSVF